MMKRVDAKEDLIYMLDEIDRNHICLYHSVQKKKILDYIDVLLDRYKYDTILDFKYVVSVLLKRVCGRLDQHTGISTMDENTLPFQFKMFNDNMYVVDTISSYNHLLYSKLLRINDIPMSTLILEMDQSNTYNTLSWRNKLLVNKLTIEKILMCPSIDTNSRYLKFDFDDLGIIKTVQIDTSIKTGNKFKDMNFGYEGLENLSYEVKNKAFIIKYFRCNKTRDDFEELIKKIDKCLDKKEIDKVILDLRNNTGGASEPIKVLTSFLVKKDLDSFTLVDGGTFSSGMIDAYYMRYYAASKIIGEEIGESITNFGNLSKEKIILPHSGIIVRGADKYFYLNDDKKLCSITAKNSYKKIKPEEKIIKYIPLDRQISITLNDIKSGLDPVMDYAINHDPR